MEIIQAMGYSFPMTSAVICLVLVVLYYNRRDNEIQRRLNFLMILTYGAAAAGWVGIIMYVIWYRGIVLFNTFFFLALMLDQVLLYHFVFTITRTETTGRFPVIHYIIPFVLATVMGIWCLVVPYEVQYYLIESRGETAPGYELFSLFFLSKMPVFLIYSLIYPFLSFRRVRTYRREIVHYSADEQRSSSRWLYKLILLIWLTLPGASVVLFAHRSVIFSSVLTIAAAFLPICQYLIICYNLISGNYVIIQPRARNETGDARPEKSLRINKQKFEDYISREKPYLNPSLKITDLCNGLGTNRTYLSTFINSEYGMNFSRFINYRRLAELKQIRLNPGSKELTGNDLARQAGFSSYRSYLRIKKTEDMAGKIF